MELSFLIAPFITPALGILFFAPLALYLIARWRAAGNDPQLGLKCVLYYFATIALHVTLAGTTLLIYTMIKPGEGDSKGQLYRLALGFMLPGAFVFAAHFVLLLRTNDAVMPSVRRLFAGFNLVITGLAGMAALIAGFQALFAKGSTDGVGHLAGSGVLIYGGAWGGLIWYFATMVFRDGGGSSMTPMPEVVPPPVQAPSRPESRYAPGATPPPAASPDADPASKYAPGSSPRSDQGGLPPLGGSSFPPIDKP